MKKSQRKENGEGSRPLVFTRVVRCSKVGHMKEGTEEARRSAEKKALNRLHVVDLQMFLLREPGSAPLDGFGSDIPRVAAFSAVVAVCRSTPGRAVRPGCPPSSQGHLYRCPCVDQSKQAPRRPCGKALARTVAGRTRAF